MAVHKSWTAPQRNQDRRVRAAPVANEKKDLLLAIARSCHARSWWATKWLTHNRRLVTAPRDSTLFSSTTSHAAQEANADRVNRSRREAEDIQEHAWVFFKPKMEHQAKLAPFGLGLFQVVRRRGNALDLKDEHGLERQANFSDVVMVRHPPPGCATMDPIKW